MLADNIREGDKLRSLSNNVLVSHVARSTIASRIMVALLEAETTII